ncbi:MAG: hypothetical protein HQK59_08535 [Deltaproteobacteria bacterium]|nr:hypothetical protein [Deltaproteobacteria bacterium]
MNNSSAIHTGPESKIREAGTNSGRHSLGLWRKPIVAGQGHGHRNTEVIIKVYGKYGENLKGAEDGLVLDGLVLNAIFHKRRTVAKYLDQNPDLFRTVVNNRDIPAFFIHVYFIPTDKSRRR